MFILTNGCSHSSLNFEDSYSTIISNYLEKEYGPFKTKLERITERIFNSDFNFEFNTKENINLSIAWPSKSNDFIYHETFEFLNYLKNKKTLPDKVIIQWSSPNRRMHLTPNGEWLSVTPYNNPHLQLKLEPMGSIQTLHYMILLQNYLKELKIDYVFFSYMELDKIVEKVSSYLDLDLSHFISYKGLHPLFDGFQNFFITKRMTTDFLGHPNEYAHLELANLVINKLFNDTKPSLNTKIKTSLI